MLEYVVLVSDLESQISDIYRSAGLSGFDCTQYIHILQQDKCSDTFVFLARENWKWYLSVLIDEVLNSCDFFCCVSSVAS